MKAKIKDNASAIFMKASRKQYPNCPLPKTYQDFYELLTELSGQVFEVDNMYPDKLPSRIVLKYPKPIIEHDEATKKVKIISGIDLDINLVDILEE